MRGLGANDYVIELILGELRVALNDSVAAAAFAGWGLDELSKRLQQLPVATENPDPQIYVGVGDPNTEEARQYASWRLSEARSRVEDQVPRTLSQHWVVAFFALWEHGFRPALAAAHGCDASELVHPVFGDLRHMRNDVVHHHGIATPENTGKCELLRWFEPGANIHLEGQHFVELNELFPWDTLRAGPAT
jgi:hypothetical protein